MADVEANGKAPRDSSVESGLTGGSFVGRTSHASLVNNEKISRLDFPIVLAQNRRKIKECRFPFFFQRGVAP